MFSMKILEMKLLGQIICSSNICGVLVNSLFLRVNVAPSLVKSLYMKLMGQKRHFEGLKQLVKNAEMCSFFKQSGAFFFLQFWEIGQLTY